MSEGTYTFEQARARLEDISKQAKGASLEKCLDLLEEGVKLANICTEKIDHTRWRDEVEEAEAAVAGESPETSEEAGEQEADEPADDVADDVDDEASEGDTGGEAASEE